MEVQYRDTLPNDVRSAFDNAIAALPQEHLRAPLTGDEMNSPEEALRWFQDYAFTQGFAVVTASKSRDRLRVDCIHHGKKTRNTRKLPDTVTKGGDRKKELTYVKAKECPYGLYVSYKTIRSGQGGVEERKGWVVGFTYTYHTHPPLQNPFHYACHRSRIPGRAEAVELALAHRVAGLAATESTRILDQHGLGNCFSAKEFYNMSRSEGRRSSREALDLLLTCLEFEDFRVRCHFKNLLDDQGRRTARILEHLFFCSSEQIRLGRRFVSGFVMQTDATFNTNCLHLPLSVIVGITLLDMNLRHARSCTNTLLVSSIPFFFSRTRAVEGCSQHPSTDRDHLRLPRAAYAKGLSRSPPKTKERSSDSTAPG